MPSKSCRIGYAPMPIWESPGSPFAPAFTATAGTRPYPTVFFVSGGSNRAFLYCEVKNFASETTSEGLYRTRIAHRLELMTPQGHSVWKDPDEMEVVDVCLNRRTDFFFNRLVQLPLGINPGDYVLKVTVEDKIKSQVDEASLLIEIKPAGSVRP